MVEKGYPGFALAGAANAGIEALLVISLSNWLPIRVNTVLE